MVRRPRRLLITLAAGLGAAVALVGLQATVASADPPPARIDLVEVFSDTVAPSGTPTTAVPYVLAEAGDPVHVRIEVRDAAGTLTSFNKATQLVVTASTGAGNQPVPDPSWVIPAGVSTHVLTTSLAQPANQVRLTLAVATGRGQPTGPAPGVASDAQLFDVLAEIRLEQSTPGFARGIGGDGTCTEATPERPVCGVVRLPNGAVSAQVLLSLGVCDSAYAGCSSARGSVVQVLADMTGRYTKTSPATVVMKCDKTLCGGAAIHKQMLSYSLAGNAALTTAAPCPAKNTIGAAQEVCVDYVESERDRSGDTHLHLLFTRDARVSWR
ncbi:MAG TPA: hypothetical protein VFJ28_00270 [Marmoricola sp.]|nr:hypothetical protein [Marmoricola sp.]